MSIRPYFSNATLPSSPAGSGLSSGDSAATHVIQVAHDNYTVTIELDLDGRFLRVMSVSQTGSFMTPMQRAAASGFHDVDDLYSD